ncbi:MAG: AAA family ATPase [Eubacteriales bacterium]|nr:AAA family ATPase [Eubacteriales bacterium]
MAERWSVTERTVTAFCKSGRIPGAVKNGKSWQIPDDAEKPADGRVLSGKYRKKTAPGRKKSLPIGISDYVRAQSEYYYVDKTLLIREFLDQKPLVSLFTRPRRFGKTLNMDMLRVFFEISEEDTGRYFKDKAIWRCGETYRAHQGKYPVVFLTFKDVKFDSWEATLDKIRGLLQEEYGRHQELMDSDRIAGYEKEYFGRILKGTANEVELTCALEKLSKMLASHYSKAPVIIIDEYDTPIHEGYSKEFYDEIIGFMRNFFSGAFKDNKNLSYGFLTGIFRIAQESIFSGLNNLSVNSVMDEAYDRYFGFTEAEVQELLEYYGAAEKEAELKDWYDGYLFGREEIYNPWSVINYLSKGCVPQAYWVNTGKNEILEEVLRTATDDITERLFALLQGERVIARIDQNVVYRSLLDDPANIYSLLLVAGYLKTPKKELQADGSYLCEVSIPNREIAAVYKSEILSHLLQIGAITRTTADQIAESLYANDLEKLQNAIAEYMEKTVSFYDAGAEGFYHGLVLGLIALMDNQYKIRSNRESGDGRYDISLIPREQRYPGIIMELKWRSRLNADDLEALAEDALAQIDDRRYGAEMEEEGLRKILKLGIAFSGKRVSIKQRSSRGASGRI